MSTEQIAKRTLPAKFNKFMVYGYWLANQLKSRELINEEVYNTIVKQQNMFDSVEAQTESFETFLEEFKSANKTMKQEVRSHNKPKKVKKEKVVDPDAPKAKRGRKKKVVEDNLTPEEKLVEEIVSAAHSETIEKPVVEETTKKVRKSKKEKVEEPIEQPVEEVVEQVVKQPVEEVVEEKSKKVRKSKKTKTEDIKVPNSILPHRVEGRLRCLPHKDEGIVNGGFVKGETTARNERRYVLEMQQDKINYKSDGIKQVKYELISEEKLTPFATMINIKL